MVMGPSVTVICLVIAPQDHKQKVELFDGISICDEIGLVRPKDARQTTEEKIYKLVSAPTVAVRDLQV
jgi:hypothetical protein